MEPGIAGALLIPASYTLYVLDKKRFHPDAKAWGILALVGFMALAGGEASGSGESSLLLVTEAICPAIIFGICLKSLRERPRLAGEEIFACVVALLGLCGWIAFNKPSLGLLACAFLDWHSGLRIFFKAWKRPSTEPLFSWMLSTFGCILSLGCIADEGCSEGLYILSYTFVQILIFMALIRPNIKPKKIVLDVVIIKKQALSTCPALTISHLDALPGWVWS